MKKSLKAKSCFITFEGIDGCGKSTQTLLVYQYLTRLGFSVAMFREPGSTAISEKIRSILLNEKNLMSDITELLLYQAARSELTAREIKPELAKGNIVLCDRFYDSTTAYQGYGRGLDLKTVRTLHRIATKGLSPDLTLLFDIDLKTAVSRRKKKKDRLESESKTFFLKVRKGFQEIARKDRRRVKVIDATQPVENVFIDVKKIISRKLKI